MLRFAAEDASSVHSLTGHDVSARSVTEAIVVKAEELLRSGQLHEALAALESEVRADPANAKLRVFLFQLLCVLGDWERALTQLNTAAELDAILPMPSFECSCFSYCAFWEIGSEPSLS
ncbi:MAG: tetratricopeptide repeat protein [Planctomycetota bacterium]|jgi:thioredoxin-like negative regulator of GroEL